LFDSGSTTVKDRYHAVLTRVATALNEVPGQVVVTGHTDNTKINTIRFPSNFQLSQARADVVKEMLERYVKTPNRIRAEGRADANPIAANDSPAGRAANRRVEVTLLVAPAGGAAPPPPATGK
jgi:type VI secretion system protein ImpK